MADFEFESVAPAGLLRRLAAMVYDGVLLLAIWFVLGWVAVYFSGGEAAPRATMQALVLGSTVLFLGGFWMRDGRTLGMLAWRLQLAPAHGRHISLRMIGLRLLGGALSLLAFGLGFLWMLWDPEKRMWQDLLSGTRVILVPRGRRWS